MSSNENFHLFLQLPKELRFEIYLLATEPRFVELERRRIRNSDSEWNTCQGPFGNQETDDDTDDSSSDDDEDSEIDIECEYDEFDKRLSNSLPTAITLHPSLSYFSNCWRDRVKSTKLPPRHTWNFAIRDHRRVLQTPLTAFGFSTTTLQTRPPWPPTPQVPDVCRHWLSAPQNRDVAWNLIGRQRTALHSGAPIPVLLHTCSESRAMLMRHGYALSFATRAGGPALTWFCPSRDVLYLRWQPDDRCMTVLDGGDWAVGRFLPEDLVKVQRLALCSVLYPYARFQGLDLVSSTLQLLPNVRELFVVQQNLNSWTSEAFSNLDVGDTADSKLWYWVECDEAEAVHLYPDRSDPMANLPIADYGHLAFYKREHGGDSSGYFAEAETTIEQRLRCLRDTAVASVNVAPWSIPSVKVVHVGSIPLIKILFERRDCYWMAVENRKQRRKGERKLATWRARVHSLRSLQQAEQLRSITPPPQSPSGWSSADEDELDVLRSLDLQQEARLDDKFALEDIIGGPEVYKQIPRYD